jgi:hypothetical protein
MKIPAVPRAISTLRMIDAVNRLGWGGDRKFDPAPCLKEGWIEANGEGFKVTLAGRRALRRYA